MALKGPWIPTSGVDFSYSSLRKSRCLDNHPSLISLSNSVMAPVPYPKHSPQNESLSTSPPYAQPKPASMSAEAIISLAFGLAMFIVAILSLRQGYRRHQGALREPGPRQSLTTRFTHDVFEAEQWTLLLSSRKAHRSRVASGAFVTSIAAENFLIHFERHQI